jgi:hypothetical protein
MRLAGGFVVLALLVMAAPAWAAAGDDSDPGPATTAGLGQLSIVPPGGVIMAGAEGASGSGAGSIFLGALYGGLAGAAVGAAVGLIEGGNYGRDIAIGGGIGILVGAVLGATNAFGARSAYPVTDGLRSTDRDPVLQGQRVAFGGSF